MHLTPEPFEWHRSTQNPHTGQDQFEGLHQASEVFVRIEYSG